MSFAPYGHPMVSASPARRVVEEGVERGLDVKVVPGIPSVDCIYADLALDPAEHGIRMFEAADLLVREFDLNPRVTAMIWGLGSILRSGADSHPERFTPVRG